MNTFEIGVLCFFGLLPLGVFVYALLWQHWLNKHPEVRVKTL